MPKAIGEIVDVSHHQNDKGKIDWAAVRKSGIVGAIIKGTEGNGYVDPFFKSNLREALAQKFPEGVGAYHFARITDSQDAVAEAMHFVGSIKDSGVQFAVLDMEEDSNKLSVAALTKACNLFIATVKKQLGIKVGLYMNLNYYRNEVKFSDSGADFLWLAQYRAASLGPGVDCDLWQYTDAKPVPGIKGGVDCSFLYKSILVGPHTAPPVAKPSKPAPQPTKFKTIGSIKVVGVTNSAIVMDKPDRNNCKQLGTVAKNAVLQITGSVRGKNSDTGYWEVVYNGKLGYITGKFGVKQ